MPLLISLVQKTESWFSILKNLPWLHLGNGFNRYHYLLFKCWLWCLSLWVWVLTGVSGFYWKCSESRETRTWTDIIDDSGNVTSPSCSLLFGFPSDFVVYIFICLFFLRHGVGEGGFPSSWIFPFKSNSSKPFANFNLSNRLSKSYLWEVA